MYRKDDILFPVSVNFFDLQKQYNINNPFNSVLRMLFSCSVFSYRRQDLFLREKPLICFVNNYKFLSLSSPLSLFCFKQKTKKGVEILAVSVVCLLTVSPRISVHVGLLFQRNRELLCFNNFLPLMNSS